MDTSEIYIKMSDHPKIQEQWKPANCDCYCNKEFSSEIKYVDAAVLSKKQIEVLIKYCIWLPRQDEIQEMMHCNLFEMVKDFAEFMAGRYVQPSYDFKTDYGHSGGSSFEKYWLAFYMYEKHKLIWDGKEWIKEK